MNSEPLQWHARHSETFASSGPGPAAGGLNGGDYFLLAVLFGLFYILTPFDFISSISGHSLAERPTEIGVALDELDSGSVVRQAAMLFLGSSGILALAWSRLRGLNAGTPLAILTAAYLVLAIASPLWSEDPAITIRKVVVLTMLLAAAAALAQRWNLDKLTDAAVVLCTGVVVLGLAAEISLDAFRPLVASYRFRGVLHPNAMGTICAILAVAALAKSIRGSVRRGAYLSIAVIAAVLMVLTKSRGALSGFVVPTGILVISELRRRGVQFFVLGIGVLAAISLLFIPWIFEKLVPAFALGRPEAPDIRTLTGRTYLWADLLGYAHQHPWLGFGYRTFWNPRHILELARSEGWYIGSSHSSYVDSLLSLGWIGLGCFVSIFVTALGRSWILRNKLDGPGGLFGVLLVCLLMTNMLVDNIVFETTIPSLIALVLLLRLAFGNDLGPSRQVANARRRSAMGEDRVDGAKRQQSATELTSYHSTPPTSCLPTVLRGRALGPHLDRCCFYRLLSRYPENAAPKRALGVYRLGSARG